MNAMSQARHVHANVPIVSAADLHLVESPVVAGACEPPFGALPKPVRGRDDMIDELRNLGTAPSGGVAVLSGQAGCGKTTIALATAYQLAGVHQVFWVSAHNRASFLDGMAAVARRLRASSAEISRAREESSADLAWRLLRGQLNPPDSPRNILVIDNADDPGLASDVIRRALGLAPTQWLTIVTTRIKAKLSGSESATTLEVDWPSTDACAHLLLDRIRELDNHRRSLALPSAREAVKLLGRVPLALHLAGLNQGSSIARYTLSDYVGELSRAPARRPGLRIGEPAYHLLPAMNLALGSFAPEERDTALQMLGLLAACAPGQPFPLGALTTVTKPASGARDVPGRAAEPLVYRSVRLLAQTGLIDLTTYDDLRVAVIHPLIAKAAAHVDGIRQALAHSVGGGASGVLDAISEAVDAASAEYVQPGVDVWPLWRLLIPHVAHVLTGPGSDGDVAALRTAHRAIHHLMRRGMYRSAAEMAGDAVERTSALPDEHEAQRRTAALDLGLALQACGDDLKRAFHYINGVAVKTRRDCRADDPEAMHAGHCLAAVLHEMGEIAGSEQLFRQVLAVRRRTLGPDNLDTLGTMHGLSAVLQAAGRAAEAEQMLTEVLAGRMRLLSDVS
jgi:hypothetical protein